MCSEFNSNMNPSQNENNNPNTSVAAKKPMKRRSRFSSNEGMMNNNENINNVENEAVQFALERIHALQQELAMDSNSDDSDTGSELEDFIDGEVHPNLMSRLDKIDSKTLGFLACAHETMRYLTSLGLPRDDPMMINLRNRLIEGIYKL